MVLHEQGGRGPSAALGQARMVYTGRSEVERDYVDHRCPACDRGLKVRAAYAGRAVVCKSCGSGFVAALALPTPVILPIADHRASADPRPDAIEYLASRFAAAVERNRRLETERRRLRDQLDDLRAELLRRSGRRAVRGDAVHPGAD